MALPMAGCHLPQGTPRRARGLGGGAIIACAVNQGRPARDPGAGHRRIRSQAVLGEVSDQPEAAWTDWGETGDLGRARGTQSGDCTGVLGYLAALPGAFHAQPSWRA